MVSRGFTLVEVIVALTILSVGVLGAVAASGMAARRLREAHAEARAALLAAAILDSLLAEPAPAAGVRDVPTGRAVWLVAPEPGDAVRIELVLESQDGTGLRRHVFAGRRAPGPYRLGSRP